MCIRDRPHPREPPQRQNNIKIPKIIKTQHHDKENHTTDVTIIKQDSETNESQYLHSNQPNSTNMNTIMDDLSNINSFVTSSVIKDIKSTPSKILENSPVLYRKRSQSASIEKEKGQGQENQNKKKKEPSSIKENALPSLDSPSTLLPIQTSPLRKYSKPLAQQIDKLNAKVTSIQRLMGEDIKNLDSEIVEAESSISNNHQRLTTISHQIKDAFDSVSSKVSIKSISDLQSRIKEASSELNSKKQNYIQSLEKSQALKLATVVQDEESKVDADPNSRSHPENHENKDSSPTSKSSSSSPNNTEVKTKFPNDKQHSYDKNEMLELATELTFLQFKRRMTTLKTVSYTHLDVYKRQV